MIKVLGIYWTSPGYVWLLVFVALAIAALVYKFKTLQRIIALLGGKFTSVVLKNYSFTRFLARSILLVSSLLLLVTALCRPQWKKKEELVAQEGRDVLIALDISRSMLAADLEPNRLTMAKNKIKKLLSFLDCERVGLILFSGSAFVQCPLTNDYSAFFMYLDHVDAETISSGSTIITQAISQALNSYKSMPSKKSKLLVIFTDGEDFSEDLHLYKQQARDQNLKIFTVGVGTQEGAPIPIYDEQGKRVGHQKDKKGNVVISHLNDDILSVLAKEAGGNHIRLTSNNDDMRQIVDLIKRFEKERFEDKKVLHFEDKYYLFLLMSFVCLGIEWLL